MHKRKIDPKTLLVCASMLAAALLAGSVAAKSVISAKVAKYCHSSESCAICHGRPLEKATIEDLNVFGRQFRKALLKAQDEKAEDPPIVALKAVADADADGDSATNFEEICLGSNPGDADSKPEPKKLARFREEHGRK
ncbi:MAG TPA: hypothetical protein VGP72_07540 [Planctomycetota bacterium]|jgi:cytochrome c553